MADDGRSQAFAAVMSRLRQNYVSGLAAKADSLASAYARHVEGEPDAADEIGHIVHRLAGTAGSFDVFDVSERASAMDVSLQNGVALADLSEELSALIELLRERNQDGQA